MLNYDEQIKQFVTMLQKEPIVKRNLLDHTWISGSQTEVHPITLMQYEIELQWKSNREPKQWIDTMVKKSNGIIQYGYFSRSDGSCPSRIVFRLVHPRY